LNYPVVRCHEDGDLGSRTPSDEASMGANPSTGAGWKDGIAPLHRDKLLAANGYFDSS
jgi:hypothetical protein